MDYLFVGVDLSKDKIDVSILDASHQVVLNHAVFANNDSGIQQFLQVLAEYGWGQLWVCMEHTGHYGALIACKLAQAGILFSVINPLEIKRSSGLTRGKDDVVDAYRIASYGVKNHYKLKPHQLLSKALQTLKTKLAQRDFYVKGMVQNKNNLKSLEVLNQSQDCKEEIRMVKRFIRVYQKAIEKLEKQMQDLIEEQTALKTSYDKISKIDGIGPVTALSCIAATDNFTRFTKPRKFCCHAGLAPFSHESGSSIKAPKRTSSLRNRKLKTLLIRAAMTAAIHDPQMKAYKERKIEQGKHKMIVYNAIASKLVNRIFAVALREEPFVKFAF